MRGLRDTHQIPSAFPTLFMDNHASRQFVKKEDFKFVCSFQKYSKKACNLSAQSKSARSICTVKNCSSSTKGHLCGCFKTSREGVEEDGNLCLARVGLLDECREDFTIFPEHRNEFGLEGGQVKFVNIPSIIHTYI